MSTRDSDIEFDFFDDEPETEEATQRRRIPRPGPPGGGGDGPRRPSLRTPTGLTPLLRLVGAVAFVIFLIVVLIFGVQSCRGASKRHAYERYMQKVSVIAHDSEQTGRDLNEALTTPGLKQNEIENKLANLAQQETQSLTQAQAISPPGRLRTENDHMVEALQFRVSGLRGLADAFRRTATSKDSSGAGLLLAAEAQRLVASDVVWDDLFKDPSKTKLDSQGITGVNVPDSNFVQNPDLASTRSMVLEFERVHGTASGGATTTSGLHGTGIASVKALPDGITLNTSSNTITASTDLAFEVTVQDTGDNQEVRIPVTLTIQKSPRPLVATQTIDVINPGETKTLTFHKIDVAGAFGLKSSVRVDVKTVPGETNSSNNTAEYPVIFSLG